MVLRGRVQMDVFCVDAASKILTTAARCGGRSIFMSRKGPVVGSGMLDFVRIERLDLVLH